MTRIFELTERVAIVTGAGSGIGRATALLLAELGARVLATDINAATVGEVAGQAANGAIIALEHDVTSEADWGRVFDFATERYGRLDILVNNAGIMRPGAFEIALVDDLRQQYRINVESVFVGMQGALPLMRASIAQHGAAPSIVNLSSVYGEVAGSEFAAYSASKAAVRMLSKAVASELAPSGIRVNSILPGPTATNIGATWDPPRDADGNLIPKDVLVAKWEGLIPMGRRGASAEIASAVAFLAGDASAFMTGAELVVDGGYVVR